MKQSGSFQVIELLAALALTALSAGCAIDRPSATSPTGSVLSSPGTNVAQTLETLRDAERADRMNSKSHTDSNPSLDQYYARKADEVHAVIVRIQRGESVPADDVNEALNNDEATQY